jgi:hypothetical protein
MTGASAAFLKFSRDKRGYEHFYLVQPITNRRGKTRSRILYWFRTPPGVRVGRVPFDDEVRRVLESTNPGVAFDWKKLLATPIPPPAPDVERWRERRRVDRAERAARKALAAPLDEEMLEPENDTGEPKPADIADVAVAGSELVTERDSTPVEAEALDDTAAAVQTAPGQIPAILGQTARKRRRRRRGGRRRQSPQGPQGPANPNPPSSNGGTKL